MVVFIILLSMIIVLVSIFGINIKEHFISNESFLKDVAETVVTNLESMRCFKNKNLDTSAYDVLASYRLLENPTDKKKCYFRMSDSLIQGDCSKFNNRIYTSRFGDLIQNIETKKIEDPHSGTSLPEKMCELKLGNTNDSGMLNEYLTHLEENDPKMKVLLDRKREELRKLALLKQQYAEEVRKTNAARELNASLTRQINDTNTQISNTQATINRWNAEIPQHKETIERLKRQLAQPVPCKAAPAPASSFCNGLNPSGSYPDTFFNHAPQGKLGTGTIKYDAGSGSGTLNNGTKDYGFKCVSGSTFEIEGANIKGDYDGSTTIKWTNSTTWKKAGSGGSSSFCNGLNPSGSYTNTYFNNAPNTKFGTGRINYDAGSGKGSLNNGSKDFGFKCVSGSTFEIEGANIKGNYDGSSTMNWTNNSTWKK
jgi:hypothetical protein